ncbi:hypothetical protein [Flaviaesturariibacter aridisoli]|uniref:Uncharacterized protein n=1 Tax=Flaviaesturariibacter aridisoli TaxID=2545761 RepID=A0A4R4E6K3_9BACT|nr:hypothetical protein [Flaviaesturariibacter aridisoli]TCZ73661.1 hypothetical protein E0486_05100 [Flaviaesturariibacter aridisoli]
MTPSEQQIARLQEKLLLLVKQQQRLRSENAELRQQLAQATDDRQALAVQVQDLQQAVALMKLAAGSLNDTEKRAFEKQVNKFIREIDKVIAHLST